MVTVQSIINSALLSQINRAAQDRAASIYNLSSGIKNNASVADFSVGTVLANQANSLRTAAINAGQGKSLLETADAALDEILSLLQEQKALATQATDSSLTSNELANLNQEFQSIKTEIDRLVSQTKFNGKVLLDGSTSGTSLVTSATGQSSENYTLLTTGDYSVSGTTASGELTSSPFAIVETQNTGKTFASTTITLTHDGGGALSADAIFAVGGEAISFGNGDTTTAQLGTSLVAALEASTNNTVRQFTYRDNGDGTITATATESGTTANTVTFQLTNDNSGSVATATLGTSTNIKPSTSTISAAAGSTEGTVRTVASADRTFDPNLQGAFSNFTAALDTTTGPQNLVTFTVDINGSTYTSQQVALFGTGGFNSQGNTIKNGQVITFINNAGPTDSSGEYTDNSFTLTVDSTDITISGGTQTAFETDLTATATGFGTQLTANRINQSRDIILTEVNASGGDFDISAAIGTTFAGIEGFDAEGTNAKGDITLVSDSFGATGIHGRIGSFDFDRSTNIITTTIDGETFTSNISDDTANTGGIVNGAGSYNSTTKTITVGSGTTIVFHSAATNDGRQLRLDLSNLSDTSVEIGTSTLETTFEDDLDTLFGVDLNPSLTFQVGSDTSDTISVDIDSVDSDEIYKNDSGVPVSINLLTNSAATTAGDVIDNAIDSVLSAIADVNGKITAFSSAANTNTLMADIAEASSATLLNTDFARESTLLAEATLRLDSGIAVLAQSSLRAQSILSLLSN